MTKDKSAHSPQLDSSSLAWVYDRLTAILMYLYGHMPKTPMCPDQTSAKCTP